MKIRIAIVGLSLLISSSISWGQAPKGWTQNSGRTELESGVIQLGDWTSPDETQRVILVQANKPEDAEGYGNAAAGVLSGTLRSGVYPEAIEKGPETSFGILIRGQVSTPDFDYFQDTYIVLVESGLLVVKASSADPNSRFSPDGWDFGSTPETGKYKARYTKLLEDFTTGLPKFQELAREHPSRTQ